MLKWSVAERLVTSPQRGCPVGENQRREMEKAEISCVIVSIRCVMMEMEG